MRITPIKVLHVSLAEQIFHLAEWYGKIDTPLNRPQEKDCDTLDWISHLVWLNDVAAQT